MTNNDARQYVIYRFSQIERQLVRWYQQRLMSLEITFPVFYAMTALMELCAVTPTQLANRLALSKPTVTALIDRMYHHGWINRDRHSSNRKLIIISLTANGKHQWQQAFVILQRIEEELAGKIDVDQLNVVFDQLTHKLDESESINE